MCRRPQWCSTKFHLRASVVLVAYQCFARLDEEWDDVCRRHKAVVQNQPVGWWNFIADSWNSGLIKWQLAVNPDKCKVMHLGHDYSTTYGLHHNEKPRVLDETVAEKDLDFNTGLKSTTQISKQSNINFKNRYKKFLPRTDRVDVAILCELAVLTYQCLYGLAPRYLSDYIQSVAVSNRRRLCSSSSFSQLVIRRTRLSTVGDRAFPVAGCRLWNSLLPDVTSASTLSVFRNRLKTHLFSRSFPS